MLLPDPQEDQGYKTSFGFTPATPTLTGTQHKIPNAMSQNLSSTCGQSSPGILEETHLSCCDRLPGQSEVITQKPTVKGSSDQDPAIVVAPFSQQACEIPANNGLSHGLHQFT